MSEKIIFYGVSKLSDAELLTELIGDYGVAHEIMCRESGAEYLVNCTVEELEHIKGVGRTKAKRIVAAVELGKRLVTSPKKERVVADSPNVVADLLMPNMRWLKQECFKVLLLNLKNEITAIEEVSVGNVNSSVADSREVFRPAIKRGAARIVLVHNHPSGNPEPSSSDVAATIRLIKAGEFLGIKVLDHVVIGDGTYVSMKESNLV
jgi:DNA repair protein RadC